MNVRAASGVAYTVQTCPQMGFCSPGARSASHGHAGQQDGVSSSGCLLDLPVDNHGWTGYHQLEVVLHIEVGIVEEDILRAGADIDGEYFHGGEFTTSLKNSINNARDPERNIRYTRGDNLVKDSEACMTLEEEKKHWQERTAGSIDRHLHERKPKFETPSGIPLPPILTPSDPDTGLYGPAWLPG